MNSVVSFIRDIANSIATQAHSFDSETWCVLAAFSVIGGYFLLRGNILKAT